MKYSKLNNPKSVALNFIKVGNYLIGSHALERMKERRIDIADIKSVVINGSHIPKRDRKYEVGKWSYCFEGRNFDDKRDIRVILSIEEKMFIVTVVDIS
jgi:Domain of unknown function (DUF4258)